MFKRFKEKQSLLEARTRTLGTAERIIKDKDILIRNMEEQAEVLYQEKKSLEIKLDKAEDILKEIENLAKTQQYGSINNLQNKIKSILMTAKSI